MPAVPSHLKKLLPESTQAVWSAIAEHLPKGAYLVGGTAISAHLAHRQSRDLDFFVAQPFDARLLAKRMERLGDFVATTIDSLTLNGVFGATPVQFLDASDQRQIDPPVKIGGIPTAGLRDLLATKLHVIGQRGELRDYFDVMVLELEGGLTVEEGLAFYLERYRPETPEALLTHVVRALGHFADVLDDPGLPVTRRKVETYWKRRQPRILRSLGRFC